MACPKRPINVKSVITFSLNAVVKMVYSGVAVTIPTALPVITKITTGPSFDFFTTKDTQKDSSRAGGYRLRPSLCMGGCDLAKPLHFGCSQHATGQHLVSGRYNASGFLSCCSVLDAKETAK